jgi:hypothetical protein
MHVELVVPALFQPDADASALELLLARGRRTAGKAGTLEDWYRDAFGLQAQALPAGALTALAYGKDAGRVPDAATWLRADPVHLRADRDRLLLIPSAGFEISADEARQLCAELNRHFSKEFTLHVFAPEIWGLQARSAMTLQTRPPIEIAGRSVDAELPEKGWHALLNEIQMALYQHPVNTAREARGAPVVNSLWPWGAGPLPDDEPVRRACRWQSLSAEDPVALGLARLAGMRHRPAGRGAAEWLERAPEDGRHIVVLDSLRGAAALGDGEALTQRLQALEERWFAPLLAALRAGRIGMLTAHVPEAGASFETVRGDLRRFWRRPRPLADYRSDNAGMEGSRERDRAPA